MEYFKRINGEIEFTVYEQEAFVENIFENIKRKLTFIYNVLFLKERIIEE